MTPGEYMDQLDVGIGQLIEARDIIRATQKVNPDLTNPVRASIRTRVLTQVSVAATTINGLVLD